MKVQQNFELCSYIASSYVVRTYSTIKGNREIGPYCNTVTGTYVYV